MKTAHLIFVYVAIGVASGIWIWVRSDEPRPARLANAGAALLLWPVWLPLVGARPQAPHAPDVVRILSAMSRAGELVRGGPFAALLPAEHAARFQRQVLALDRQRAELDAELARLVATSAPAAGDLSDRTRSRLREARAEIDAALAKLADLCELLSAELVLRAHGGADRADIDALIAELWLRVEGVESAL